MIIIKHRQIKSIPIDRAISIGDVVGCNGVYKIAENLDFRPTWKPHNIVLVSDDKIIKEDWSIINNNIVQAFDKTLVDYLNATKCPKIIAVYPRTKKFPYYTPKFIRDWYGDNKSMLDETLPTFSLDFIKKWCDNSVGTVAVEYDTVGKMKSGGVETHISEIIKLTPDNEVVCTII